MSATNAPIKTPMRIGDEHGQQQHFKLMNSIIDTIRKRKQSDFIIYPP